MCKLACIQANITINIEMKMNLNFRICKTEHGAKTENLLYLKWKNYIPMIDLLVYYRLFTSMVYTMSTNLHRCTLEGVIY